MLSEHILYRIYALDAPFGRCFNAQRTWFSGADRESNIAGATGPRGLHGFAPAHERGGGHLNSQGGRNGS